MSYKLDKRIDAVIHFAGYKSVIESIQNPILYWQNNVIGTKNLVEACKNSEVKNIIYSSSCSIYGNTIGSVSEHKKPNPMGYYASTKDTGQNLSKTCIFLLKTWKRK